MAEYKEHLFQVNRNLNFLECVNKYSAEYIDWQVTTCFYVGVHLINSFLAREANAHFSSHEKVKEAISPQSPMHKTRLDETTYLNYGKLRNLSRRSRYLCNGDEPHKESNRAHLTTEKHFIRAFKYLDALLAHFEGRYHDQYKKVIIAYPFTKPTPNCTFFQFKSS